MSKEQKQVHVCSPCAKEFSSEEEYLAHECKVTGLAPTDPEHQKATRVIPDVVKPKEKKK